MKTLVRAWPIVVISLIGLLASLEAYTVIIDPGHGGSDPGAVRPGAYEKQLTLSTSVMLAAELRRLGVPYVMTRYSDETCSLISRRDLAARYPGSVFVSIHYNAAQSTAASGIETFYHGTSGRALGAQVQRALIYMTGAPNRGLKKRGFKFCGPTIVYAWMEACGLVNDHLTTCPQHSTCAALTTASARPRPQP